MYTYKASCLKVLTAGHWVSLRAMESRATVVPIKVEMQPRTTQISFVSARTSLWVIGAVVVVQGSHYRPAAQATRAWYISICINGRNCESDAMELTPTPTLEIIDRRHMYDVCTCKCSHNLDDPYQSVIRGSRTVDRHGRWNCDDCLRSRE